ncbi:MAG: hypothetical protein OQJ98_00065 [Candidatus Pacebacteria bacterium]|nr:hypothetical protein [Candidatus Paceibacterota bacterium]
MERSTEELIKQNLELTKENNKLLRKMRRHALWGGILKLLWIAALIGVPVYLYINFLAPVLDQVLGAAQAVQEVGGKVEGLQGQLQDIGGSGIEDILNIFNR